MYLKVDVDWKSLIMGSAISTAIVIMAATLKIDILFAAASIGILYVGYNARNLAYGAILGALAATPIVYITFTGTLGTFTGFFTTPTGSVSVVLLILCIGALIGFVGAWAKRDRLRAKEEYEKKQKIGKNKNKKKNNN